nr:hypothetical protein [uncultured bacterium]
MTNAREEDARRFARAMKANMKHETRHMRRTVWALAVIGAGAAVVGWVLPSPPAFVVGSIVSITAVCIQLAAMRASFSEKDIIKYAIQQEWKKLATSVKSAYSKQSDKVVVDKLKLAQVLEAFGAVYNARSSKNEESFYLGKLISTGVFEGNVEQAMGTVPVQLQKTIEFIRKAPQIYASQAAIFSEPLINCLDKESFETSLDIVLSPYIAVLEDIAKGNV